MQSRDHLNTFDNYNNAIAFYNADTVQLSEDVFSLEKYEQKGIQKYKINNKEIIVNTKKFIATNLKSIFKLYYSAGYPISTVKEAFLNYLTAKSEVLNGTFSYLEDLDILSIGILLNLDKDTMAPFIDNVARADYQDYILDFLIRYYRSEWPQHEEVQFKRPYAHLKKVMEASNREVAIRALRNYIFSKWYAGSNDAPWYNSHKAQNPSFHAGYWSFESAAVAKILKLDDGSLKGEAYYPYDLRHGDA